MYEEKPLSSFLNSVVAVLLEAQTYRSFYRSRTNRNRFLVVFLTFYVILCINTC